MNMQRFEEMEEQLLHLNARLRRLVATIYGPRAADNEVDKRAPTDCLISKFEEVGYLINQAYGELETIENALIGSPNGILAGVLGQVNGAQAQEADRAYTR